MTKNELNEFIRKGEGYQIEFKSSFDSLSKDFLILYALFLIEREEQLF